jgi:hypothetical protein
VRLETVTLQRLSKGDSTQHIHLTEGILNIAGEVQKGGKEVLPEDVEDARQFGAADLEIHRRGVNCRGLLYVQPLRGWARYLDTH